jgi:hypothetical protein
MDLEKQLAEYEQELAKAREIQAQSFQASLRFEGAIAAIRRLIAQAKAEEPKT